MDIDFKKLIQLQKIDTEIMATSFFLDNVPAQMEVFEKKIEDSQQIVSSAQDKLAQNQKKRRDLEAQLQDIKEKISKYKRQLNGVKTNLEYSSLLKEIEESQGRIDRIEEDIIAEMLSADEIEEEIRTSVQKADKIKQEIREEQEDLKARQKNMEETNARLVEEKRALLPEVPAEILKQYDKIALKNSGIVLSPVTGEFCSLCFMRIRPQVLNELKTETEIILCENCGRILYLEKDEKRPD